MGWGKLGKVGLDGRIQLKSGGGQNGGINCDRLCKKIKWKIFNENVVIKVAYHLELYIRKLLLSKRNANKYFKISETILVQDINELEMNIYYSYNSVATKKYTTKNYVLK